VSPADLRTQLEAGTLPGPRIMRRNTAQKLIAAMKAKA
jgi:hypothetical protein